jgi:hypothetical protein
MVAYRCVVEITANMGWRKKKYFFLNNGKNERLGGFE